MISQNAISKIWGGGYNKMQLSSTFLLFLSGIPKRFWFKPPLTLKIFHAPPPSTVLGNPSN
jgi:hypothetical protein